MGSPNKLVIEVKNNLFHIWKNQINVKLQDEQNTKTLNKTRSILLMIFLLPQSPVGFSMTLDLTIFYNQLKLQLSKLIFHSYFVPGILDTFYCCINILNIGTLFTYWLECFSPKSLMACFIFLLNSQLISHSLRQPCPNNCSKVNYSFLLIIPYQQSKIIYLLLYA